jgi:hypothetical protein
MKTQEDKEHCLVGSARAALPSNLANTLRMFKTPTACTMCAGSVNHNDAHHARPEAIWPFTRRGLTRDCQQHHLPLTPNVI